MRSTATAHSSPLEIVLARIGCRRRGCFDHSAQRRGPERMRLPLDILEGQNFARKNDHRIRPRRAGASELASVDALDRDCQFVALRAYSVQVETLRRLRHGGDQYVRVEHVHVNDGGQAVIGNVKTAGSGTAGSPEQSASGVIAPANQDR
jgi:hypothetical protein